ncbi:hypothetical protein ASZ90_009329 [hydrocarbon metagenome]|uniref:Uncharacterized protein n=1 Tax=hydrocarbon metagenome TaxID=938273 RepID=A0A0W8FJ97_9ZZZZ
MLLVSMRARKTINEDHPAILNPRGIGLYIPEQSPHVQQLMIEILVILPMHHD